MNTLKPSPWVKIVHNWENKLEKLISLFFGSKKFEIQILPKKTFTKKHRKFIWLKFSPEIFFHFELRLPKAYHES